MSDLTISITREQAYQHLKGLCETSDSVETIIDFISKLAQDTFTTQEIFRLLNPISSNRGIKGQNKLYVLENILNLNNGPNSSNDSNFYSSKFLNLHFDPITQKAILDHYSNRKGITFYDLVKFIQVRPFRSNYIQKVVDKLLTLNPTADQCFELIQEFFPYNNKYNKMRHEDDTWKFDQVPLYKQILENTDLDDLSTAQLVHLIDQFDYSTELLDILAPSILTKENISSSNLAKVLQHILQAEPSEQLRALADKLVQKFINQPKKSNLDIANVCLYLDKTKKPSEELREKRKTLKRELKSITDFALSELTDWVKDSGSNESKTLDIMLDKLINHPDFTPDKITSFIVNTQNFSYLPFKVKDMVFSALAEHIDTTREHLRLCLRKISEDVIDYREILMPGAAKAAYRFAQFEILRRQIEEFDYWDFIKNKKLLYAIELILKGNSGIKWGPGKVDILNATSVFPNIPQTSIETVAKRSQQVVEMFEIPYSKKPINRFS